MSISLAGRPSRRLALRPGMVLAAGATVIAVLVGEMVTQPSSLRLALVGGVLVFMVGLILLVPRYVLYGLVIWLAGLGLLRRLVSVPTHGARVDPLLLVGPLALLVLVLVAARRGAFVRLSALSKIVGVLTVLALAGAVNPLQGSLVTGLAGIVFIVVPMLAFWVGRALCDDQTLRRLLKLLSVLALGGAAYGLMQTFSHFPSWDRAWINSAGFVALSVGGAIRAFGPFSSGQEYATFLAVGIAAWLGIKLRGIGLVVALAAVAFLGIAIFYESARSTVVYLVLALGVAAAIRVKLPMIAAGVVGLAFLGGLLFIASKFGSGPVGTGHASLLAAHQLQGLANPFSSTNSTLLGHLSLAGHGLHSALVYPFGVGTGAVTIAASKFGGLALGTELDPSNIAVALGIPGLLAYLAVFGVGLSRAYRLALRRKDALSRVVICVLLVTLFQWLNGGMYAVALLPWLVLGWVDRAGQEGAKVGPVPTSEPAAKEGGQGRRGSATPGPWPSLRSPSLGNASLIKQP